MQITYAELMSMEQRKRAHLINSVGGFKSICLIGTTDNAGQTNLAIFSSIVHIGANPPLICFIVRPDSVDRHTLHNIEATGHYTINHIQENFYKAAHQTSARYPREQSEFEACGLHPLYRDQFLAPYVQESTLQMGLQLRQIIKIELNNTLLIIGEIQHLYLDQSAIADDGFVDLEKLGSITCSGLDSYHRTSKISRLSYAKPDRPLTEQ